MDYAAHIAVLVLLWSTLALSQGLLTGYLGILAVHQAAAWGIGAYTAAILNRLAGVPLGLTAIPAALVAGAVLLVVGSATGNARKDDQVIASLCIQVLVVESFLNFASITGGPFGISGIGWGLESDQHTRTLAALAAGFCVLAISICLYAVLKRTRLPRSWSLVRDHQPSAEALGINAGGERALAMFLAAALAGAAGSVFAHYVTFIEPRTFGLSESVAILAIAVIGRAPSVRGVLLASLAIVVLPELLRGVGLSGEVSANLRRALFGVFLVLAIFRLRR